MQALRDPLFLKTEFKGIKKSEKGAIAISVRINLLRDDLIFVENRKGRTEVCGYIDPETGLFVADAEGLDAGSIYHRFRLEAVKFAKKDLMEFLESLSQLDEETYKNQDYKPLPVLTSGLNACLVDRQALYADLQKQVNLIASRKFPKVNEFLVFADTKDVPYPVTDRVPYKDPKGYTLSKEESDLVDAFLDVFFDTYGKYAFSWYMGAALSNIPLYDDRVSKLAILSSSIGGSGKSTLALAMADALFTPSYREIKDEFDSFFALNSRFGTSSLSSKRITIYSEASWNSDPLSDEHCFSGINVSAIKSLVTEGYVSSEAKYADRDMERLSGFHLVLTNHPPMVTAEDSAMNRRILAIMLKPTSMADKAKELNLWGRQKLFGYVKEHAQSFAAYFTSVFWASEYAFFDQDYDHRDYLQDIQDSQNDLEESQREGRKALDILKADGLIEFIKGLEKKEHADFTILKNDIYEAMGGAAKAELMEHIKLDHGVLYINSSKSFFLRYGIHGVKIRQALKEFYGDPIKRYHKRMFAIPVAK